MPDSPEMWTGAWERATFPTIARTRSIAADRPTNASVAVPLTLALSLLSLPALDHATVSAWMSAPGRALLLILLVSIAAWHSQLGVQVVIEDYVHGAGMKVLALVVSSFAHVVIAAAGVLAVLSVSLRSAT